MITKEVIIDYKYCCVLIKGNKIPFMLAKGIANTVNLPYVVLLLC